ncbi:MAG TPA: PilN domain-containing protein [Verrucomicrobiae bacterium]|nr:PilN domain-containing protein [Verrucomicrobiae bacterium]
MIYPPWVKNLFRADFVRSTGLYITPERFYLVRMRKALTNVSIVAAESRAIPPADDPAARRQALADALRSLVRFDPASDPLYVCLSSDQVMSLEMSLPQVAGDNLSQVVNYEIERYLPFRREDVYYDYVPIGMKGDKFGVLLFAAQKKLVDGLLEVLAGFGAQPQVVESSAISLSNYMLYCTGGISGPALLLGGQDHDWEITALDGKENGWRHGAVLAFTHRLPQAEWTEGPGRELFYNSLRGAPRFFGWGNTSEFLRAVGEEPLAYEDLSELGKAKLGQIDGVAADPAFLPAVGAALRGLRESAFDVNLLPGVKDQDRSRALTWLNASLAVLLLVGLAAWALTYPVRDEIRLRQLQAENQKILPAVEALRREETELNRLKKEIAFYTDLKGRRGVVMRVLDELSRIVPDSAYVSNLRYREGTVEMQGSAENASNLIPLLERSPVFENVAFNAPSTRGRDGKETFSLKADIEKPKPAGAKGEAAKTAQDQAEPAKSEASKAEATKGPPSKVEASKAPPPAKAESSKAAPEKNEPRKAGPSTGPTAEGKRAKP